MTDPTFTILMPVLRTPELMPFAIDSVLGQTRGDFELFIVADGAPMDTVAAANRAAAQDNRIRCFQFPKGERHGEAHRHTALQHARGRYVCGIADDDLWFPNHLEEMATLLSAFEFGHLLHVNILADGAPFVGLADLSEPGIRAKMAADIFNFFGPSSAGYRLETYRRLPAGWSPAPLGIPTDLAMWRKFLALPGITAGTRFVFTSLHFASDKRQTWSIEQRREEIAHYAGVNAAANKRDALQQHAWASVTREYVARHDYIRALLQRAEAAERQLATAATR
jgi:glycosyltransferase involved in cell wall biosynthesis